MTETAERKIAWRRRLPSERPVDRHDLLVEAVRGRSAIHVGFVDELMNQKIRAGIWLHSRLADAADSLVGLDADERGVRAAAELGYDVRVTDVQSLDDIRALKLRADVVIAGELIEHVDAAGPFLRAMHELAPEIVITTPNTYRLLNVITPWLGFELIHPDHVCWHSAATLSLLCERNGWEVDTVGYYRNPVDRSLSGSAGERTRTVLANMARRVARIATDLRPQLADGLIVRARAAPTN